MTGSSTRDSGSKLTYDDLVAMPDHGLRRELIDGELYVTPFWWQRQTSWLKWARQRPGVPTNGPSTGSTNDSQTPLLPGLEMRLTEIFED